MYVYIFINTIGMIYIYIYIYIIYICCCSVARSCPTLCDPMDYSTPGFSVLHCLPVFHCSVPKSCPTLCDFMDCSTAGLPVLHCLLEFAQTHVHRVNDGIQPSHPLSPPSPPALNLYKHQSLFLWVSCLHHKVLELQLQHQSFQWIFRLISFRIDWLDLLALPSFSWLIRK